MSIMARMMVDRPDGQRASGRRRIRLGADRIDRAAGLGTVSGVQDIVIHDLSLGGCSFASAFTIHVGAPIRLRIPEVGEVAARSTWLSGDRVGCAFDTPLSPEQLGAALATSPVVWGEFPENERTLAAVRGEALMAFPSAGMGAPASDREMPGGARWPVRVVALAVGAGLVAFWAAVAAIV